MVEIEGLKPSTSSMPWKHSNQLSYIPKLDHCNKNSPLFPEASLCELLRAHPGHDFVFNCLFLRARVPLEAYQLVFIMLHRLRFFKLMLVFCPKSCLNSYVQKHTLQQVLPTLGCSFLKKVAHVVDLTLQVTRKEYPLHGTTKSFHR